MEKLFVIDESLLKYLLSQASRACVGKCLKRIDLEIEELKKQNKEVTYLNNIKKQIRELLFESFRDFGNTIENCSKSRNAIYLEPGKQT